jgi:hypothetical protein
MRTVTIFLVFFCILAWTASEEASALEYNWGLQFDSIGGTGSGGHVGSLAEDSEGNIVLAGYFSGEIDFGGGPLLSAGSNDIFVAKFDASGEHLWSNRYGDINYQEAYDVAVDSAGNIIITGGFRGVLNFGGPPLENQGERHKSFLAKFSPSGQHLWSHHFPAQGIIPTYGFTGGWGEYLSVDASGNIAIYEYWYHFHPDGVDGHFETLWKIDADGEPVWSSRILFLTHGYTSGDLLIKGLEFVGDGNLIAVGELGGNVIIATETNEMYYDYYQLQGNSPGRDFFIVKFGPNRELLRDDTYGNTDDVHVMDCAVAPGGETAVVGAFSGSVDFECDVLVSGEGIDGYIVTFDLEGDPVWCRKIGDAGNQEINHVGWPAPGSLFVAGRFTGSINLGGDLRINEDYIDDYFLAEYTGDGSYLDDMHFPGTQVSHTYPWIKGLASHNGLRVYLGGNFWGVFDLGGGPLESSIFNDCFLVSYRSSFGTVEVNPDPDGLNAPWNLEGPGGYIYNGSGDETLIGVPAGDYTLTWGDVSGWTTPDPNPVIQNLPNGGLITFSGTYEGGAEVGDWVWWDDNANGIQDLGESGCGHGYIQLFDSDDNFIAWTTSETGPGHYSFTGLPPGEYYLTFQGLADDMISPWDV